MKKAKITIDLTFDENKIPQKIEWTSSDGPTDETNECKAFMLTLWDGEQKNTFRIDLWSNEMKVDEMNFFLYQSLITMADTFQRATNNDAVVAKLKTFVLELAPDLGILDKPQT